MIKIKIIMCLCLVVLLTGCEIQTAQVNNPMSEQENTEDEENSTEDAYFSGVVQEASFYHDARDEWITYYYADIGIAQFETLINELEYYDDNNDFILEFGTEIQLGVANYDISLEDYAGQEISFHGTFFEAHTVYHRRYVVFLIEEIEEIKQNWREAYAEYLNNVDFFDGFYIGDINNDGIPEVIIRYNESNSGFILYFCNDKVQALELEVISLWGKAGYLEETNQIILLHWYGHTYGTFGSVDYFLYDWTSDGYVETRSVIRESGYAEDDEETGEEHYGQGYINGETVDFAVFETALTEMDALLEKSTWFPMTDTSNINDCLESLINS